MTSTRPATNASATSDDALRGLLHEVLPPQGAWRDEDYLWLTDRCNRLVEFTDGRVQELPMPTFTHQAISGCSAPATPPGHGCSTDSRPT